MKVQFGKWACFTSWSHYAASGETALTLVSENGEPIATATVCLWPPSPAAGDGEVWLKTWGEAEGLPEALQSAGLVELTDRFERTGYSLAQLAKLSVEARAEVAALYAREPERAKARASALGIPTGPDDGGFR